MLLLPFHLGNKPPRTKVYNNNQSYVYWAHNQTMTTIHHIEMRDNPVQEWAQVKIIKVLRVAGLNNVRDIFTKEK